MVNIHTHASADEKWEPYAKWDELWFFKNNIMSFILGCVFYNEHFFYLLYLSLSLRASLENARMNKLCHYLCDAVCVCVYVCVLFYFLLFSDPFLSIPRWCERVSVEGWDIINYSCMSPCDDCVRANVHEIMLKTD